MKKLIAAALIAFAIPASALGVGGLILRSSDNTQKWHLPPLSDTLVGLSEAQTFTATQAFHAGDNLDKITAKINSSSDGGNLFTFTNYNGSAISSMDNGGGFSTIGGAVFGDVVTAPQVHVATGGATAAHLEVDGNTANTTYTTDLQDWSTSGGLSAKIDWLGNWNMTGSVSLGSFIDELQQATPATPATGHDRLYFKSDDNLYKKTSAGVESLVGGGGGISGPGTTTTTAIATWNGTTGTALNNSNVTINGTTVDLGQNALVDVKNLGVGTTNLFTVDSTGLVNTVASLNATDSADSTTSVQLHTAGGQSTLQYTDSGAAFLYIGYNRGAARSFTVDYREDEGFMMYSQGIALGGGNALTNGYSSGTFFVEHGNNTAYTASGVSLGVGSYIDQTQVATPAAPAASHDRLYFKSDDNLYKQTSAGVESLVSGGGGGGGITGPASSTTAAIATWNGITGTALNNTGITIDASNDVLAAGRGTTTFTTGSTDGTINASVLHTDASEWPRLDMYRRGVLYADVRYDAQNDLVILSNEKAGTNGEGIASFTGGGVGIGAISATQSAYLLQVQQQSGLATVNGELSVTGETALGSFVDQTQQVTPASPAVSHDRLYFKSDDNLYKKTSAGVESIVGGGSSYTFTAPLVNTAGTVTCNSASGTQPGCLASADWTTFNGKVSGPGTSTANGLATWSGTAGAALLSPAGLTSDSSGNVTGNTFLSTTSGTTSAPAIAITTASSTFGLGFCSSGNYGLVGAGGVGFACFNQSNGTLGAFNTIEASQSFPSSVTFPGFIIGNDSQTGFYHPAAGAWGFSSGGVEELQMDANALTVKNFLALPQQPAATTPTCGSGQNTYVALTNAYVMCVCNGTSWVKVADGTTACTF